MSKIKRRSYDTNPELWRASGDGGRGPQKGKKMSKYKEMAQKRWNQDAIRAVLPKAKRLPRVEPKVSSIPAWKVNELIATNNAEYPDVMEQFERNGAARLKEYVADQLPELQQFYFEEWEDRKEVFVHPAWHAQVPTVTVSMSPDELEATRRDRKTHMQRVFMSERARTKIYYRRREELLNSIDEAYERALEMQQDLDQELLRTALGREPEPFEDKRTKDQAWWAQTRQEMQHWDLEQLGVFMDQSDEPREIGYAAQLILDLLVQEYRALQFRYRLVCKETVTKDNELSWVVLCSKKPTMESKADERFSLPNRVYGKLYSKQRFEEIRPVLLAKVERMREKLRIKAQEREQSLWELQENPFRVVAALRGDDLTFKLDNGEYLEGSCTGVRYELANGMRVSCDQVPSGSIEVHWEDEVQEEQEEMTNPCLSFQDWSAMHVTW